MRNAGAVLRNEDCLASTHYRGPSRLEWCTKKHENGPSMIPFHRQLPRAAQTKVARAATIAIALRWNERIR